MAQRCTCRQQTLYIIAAESLFRPPTLPRTAGPGTCKRLNKPCLQELGFKIQGTRGTAAHLEAAGVPCEVVLKIQEGRPNAADLMKNGDMAMMFITSKGDEPDVRDGRDLRRLALGLKVSLRRFTANQLSAFCMLGAWVFYGDVLRAQGQSVQPAGAGVTAAGSGSYGNLLAVMGFRVWGHSSDTGMIEPSQHGKDLGRASSSRLFQRHGGC